MRRILYLKQRYGTSSPWSKNNSASRYDGQLPTELSLLGMGLVGMIANSVAPFIGRRAPVGHPYLQRRE
ncbi:hypothetical protein [Yersinia rohdei]|uniref:hypothetical protein n=1 Tax=Yersinia rohdei TaxID=29485 RepID=UPI000A456EF4|nr:hypothetical protein [Yersinia rohdei]